MERLFPNGWWSYLAGGILVGAGTALVFVLTGIRAGASGFFTTTLSYLSARPGLRSPWSLAQRGWRSTFAIGLLLGAVLFTVTDGRGAFVTEVQAWRLLVGGFLVGLGTRLSRGCTSGHGICGIAGGSRGSIFAVLTFMGVAIVVAHLARSLGVSP